VSLKKIRTLSFTLILSLFLYECDLITRNNSSEIDKNINVIFDKHYDIPNAKWCESSDIISVSSGGYLVVGRASISSNKPFFLRIDENGNKMWESVFNGQRVHSVVETPDGGFAATGGSSSGIYIVKSDDGGNLEWERYIEIPYDDDAHKIILTNSGDLVIAGNSYATSTSGIITKLDLLGNIKWKYSPEGEGRYNFLSLAENDDGNLVIFGETEIWTYEEEFPHVESTFWVQKLNNDGIQIYKKAVEENISTIYRQGRESTTIPFFNSQYVSCGMQYFFKLDDLGNVKKYSLKLPTRKYKSIEANKLEYNISGDLVIICSLIKDITSKDEEGNRYTSNFYEPAVLKLSSDGDLIYALVVSDNSYEYASLRSVIYNDDESIIAAGYMKSLGDEYSKIWITKFFVE